MPADDSMLSSGTVEFREEERRFRADDLGPDPWAEDGRDEEPDYMDDGGPEEDDR